MIEDRVQHQEVAAVRLAAPDRIVREKHDVSLLNWYVDDHRTLSDLRAAVEQTRHQQIARVAVAEHDARALCWRNDVDAIAKLFIANRRCLPWLDLGIGRQGIGGWTALRLIGLVGVPRPVGRRGSVVAAPPRPPRPPNVLLTPKIGPSEE